MAATLARLNLPRPARLVRAADDAAFQFSIVRGESPTQYQPNGRTIRVQGWERHPIVAACVRAIVDIVGAVPLEVYRQTPDGEAVILEQHPALALLTAPRAQMTQRRLMALTATHFQLYGNAFWVLERAGRRVIGLRLVHPEDIVFAYLGPDLEVARFDWRDRNGVIHQTEIGDILHFADLSGADWLFGYPRAAAALKDILADSEASEYVRQVVSNDGGPATLIGVPEAVRQEEARAAEDRWHERTVERGGRGRLRIVPGLGTVTRLGFDLRELEFPDARRIANERICAVFGVDPRIIGLSSAQGKGGMSSGKEFQEARFRLIQQAVVPLMGALEAQLNLWLMPEFGDVYVRFSPDGLSDLTEDETATSTRVLAEVAAKVRTVEEARKAVGLEDLPPADHLVATSASYLPMAEAIVDTSVPTVPPSSMPPAPPQLAAGASPEPDPDPARAPATRALLRSVLLTPTQRALLWRAFDEEAARREPALADAARSQFQREQVGMEALLLSAHRAGEPAADSLLQRFLRRVKALYTGTAAPVPAQWRGLAEPPIRDALMSAAQEMAVAIGADFHLEVPSLEAAITDRVNRLAEGVSQTTYEAIQAAVIAGREQQLGVREIAALIDDTAFGGIAADRSLTIARTETIGALNAGNYLAAQQSGVLKYKAWLGQGDQRMRASHADLDSYFAGGRHRLPLDAPFANGLQHPGDQMGTAEEVVNCRCTLLYYADTGEEVG